VKTYLQSRKLTQRCAYACCSLILVLTVYRIVIVDRTRPQGFDEPAHIAAGMEWLQFHSYRLDPLHPPIARVAAAAPLYLSGMRFRETDSRSLPQFWDAGNSILYRGSYLANLELARFGMLPFLAAVLLAAFAWTKQHFDVLAAVGSVILLGTLPVVLAFSSLAYTDLPAACLQFVCILMFAQWLEKPGWRRSIAVGTLFGLAVLTKFTSLLYIPVTALAILLCRLALKRNSEHSRPNLKSFFRVAAIPVIALVIIWAGYRFSIGPINEALNISQEQMPSFPHFPGPARALARQAIAGNWRIPAPSFVAGLAQAWVLNKTAPDAYLFGMLKPGGWWYFFAVETVFKTPLPFLMLVMVGCIPAYRAIQGRDWRVLVPTASALSITGLTMLASVNYGLRHVLVIFLLLAIIGGVGAQQLWNFKWSPSFGKAALIFLVGWQCMVALRPGADWIGYFNALAGKDPSRILVTGCDLDCGQDVLNLSKELRRLKVSHIKLALWTTADLQHMDLPEFDIPEPFCPQSGWFAISVRTLREGSLQHKGYPPAAFSWLNQYSPVSRIGNTILLYYIPSIHQPVSAGNSALPAKLKKGTHQVTLQF